MQHPLVVKYSAHSVAETAAKLQALLDKKGIQLFARIDHAEAARQQGLSLPDEELFIFGDPKVGTYLMQECAAIGIELPLKILIWQVEGKTCVGYRDPLALLPSYAITSHRGIVEKMAQLMPLLVNEIIG